LKILTFESDYDNCSKTKFSSKPNKLVFHDCEQNYPKYYYDLNTLLEEIRDRNKINTTLEQLFNRTLHLNESFDCIIGYRNGTIINCSQVYSLVEVFDGLNFFGKCFVYSNKNQEYYRNISQEISITFKDNIQFYVRNDFFDIVGYQLSYD
jgi:hypothetical protein